MKGMVIFMRNLNQNGYDRKAVVEYANKWALKRNPAYYNFDEVGGDCTNYASQCIYAGCGVMNYTKTFGWYYRNSRDRAPAWTSVQYLHKFLTQNKSSGAYGEEVTIKEIEIGDIVQIKFKGKLGYSHTPVVVDIVGEKTIENILISAHSFDSHNRKLSTYENVESMRFIHIVGAKV